MKTEKKDKYAWLSDRDLIAEGKSFRSGRRKKPMLARFSWTGKPRPLPTITTAARKDL